MKIFVSLFSETDTLRLYLCKQNDMSNDRLAIVKKAWQKISNGAPSVTLENIVSKYNAPKHPRVTSREKKAETVMNDFVTLIREKCAGGNVTEEMFCSYYADCNAVTPVEKETYFITTLLKVWGLEGTAVTVSA